MNIIVTADDGEIRDLRHALSAGLQVKDGDVVEKGEPAAPTAH